MMWSRRGEPISPLWTAARTTGEVGVEAAVEADLELDAGLGDGGQGGVDLGEAMVDGLLAEDVLAGAGGADDEVGVRVGGRADEDGVDVGVVQDLIDDGATTGMPQRAATCAAASWFRSVMAAALASGTRKAMVSAWTLPMRPAPMMPTLSLLLITASFLFVPAG